nr:hypothetical protein [Tanacetum cinerariifolium]
MGGKRFTSIDSIGSKLSKIDRILASKHFVDLWPYSYVTALTREFSDHTPLLLSNSITDYGPIPFKFFKSKLQHLKSSIKKWRSDIQCIESAATVKLRRKLDDLDNKAEVGPLTPTYATARIDIVRELTSLERTKVMDLRQKAKIIWAVDGDENSHFFHGMLNSKVNNSRINGLNILGSWITNPVLIKNHIYQFYESKFKETSNRRPTFTSNLFKHLSVEDFNLFDCTITPQEIKDAIWDCGRDKAPGFSCKWRTWISSCLNSAFASVLINGSPTKEFKVEKDGGLNDTSLIKSKSGPWYRIAKLKDNLSKIGIDLPSIFKKKIGDGCSTRFWLDTWLRGSPLKDPFPRLFRPIRSSLELCELSQLCSLVAHLRLSDNGDLWECIIDDSRAFSVKMMSSYINQKFPTLQVLPTRWNTLLHLKVNIFIWRTTNKRLPMRVNLEYKGIDLDSSITIANLFEGLNLANRVPLPAASIRFLDVVVQTTHSLLWRFRNDTTFATKRPNKQLIIDDVKLSSFIWISSRQKRFLLNLVAHWWLLCVGHDSLVDDDVTSCSWFPASDDGGGDMLF